MGENKLDGTCKQKHIVVRRNKSYLFVKRVIDYVGSTIGIILFSPILLIIAIVIKLEDGGPVIFKQERIGHNGRHFNIYKFRSMRIDAEELKTKLLAQNEVEGAMFKMRDDPRVTRFGKFIRKHSLDELPQFFNVFLGDMSLVGPLPPLVDEVETYDDYEKQRLLVRPGLSGLWQISGRNNLSFAEMVELDLQYIQTRSIWLDIKIMLKTAWDMVAIKKNGAY
ncbi:MAG: sugar transferase [Leuconostoc fallax]